LRKGLAIRLRFGATHDEASRPLPGDEIVCAPILEATHALTMSAPPEQIWPWLMQLGQGRAGFYSDSRLWDACVDAYYQLLSHGQANTVTYRVLESERVVPEWQNLRSGSEIIDGPPGTAYYVVKQIERPQTLVLFTNTHLPFVVPALLRTRVSGEISVTYRLVPLGDGRTRFIRRMRTTCRPFLFRLIVVPVLIVWGEVITARNLLQGVKRRAETHHPQAVTP